MATWRRKRVWRFLVYLYPKSSVGRTLVACTPCEPVTRARGLQKNRNLEARARGLEERVRGYEGLLNVTLIPYGGPFKIIPQPVSFYGTNPLTPPPLEPQDLLYSNKPCLTFHPVFVLRGPSPEDSMACLLETIMWNEHFEAFQSWHLPAFGRQIPRPHKDYLGLFDITRRFNSPELFGARLTFVLAQEVKRNLLGKL